MKSLVERLWNATSLFNENQVARLDAAYEGEWEVENRGVSPDIEVEMDPNAWRERRDPQLEKAVEVLMAALGGICLELNGTEDHVHLLAKLRPDCALSDIPRDSKRMRQDGCMRSFPNYKI